MMSRRQGGARQMMTAFAILRIFDLRVSHAITGMRGEFVS